MMKKLTFTLSLALFGIFMMNSNAQAQENFASAGIEVAMPMGDWADVSGIGLGASIGYEFGISDNFGIGANVGYTYLTAKDYEVEAITIEDDGTSTVTTEERDGFSSAIFPLQIYGRYYFGEAKEGLFISAKTGAHYYSRTYEYYNFQEGEYDEEVDTSVNFSVAPELGFFITEDLSLALRYNFLFVTVESREAQIDTETDVINYEVVEETENYGYLGLRAAWNF